MKTRFGRVSLLVFLAAAACGPRESEEPARAAPTEAAGSSIVVTSVLRTAVLQAAGTAQPWAQATLSTKLMGSVVDVAVREGDRVRAGQVLVRIDARDLEAKDAQVAATVAEAEAHFEQARTHGVRMRALFADDAATRAQLEAAEAALAAAEARVSAAHAGAAELSAIRAYSTIRAPFDGLLTARMVDPGAFASPGAPLVTVQDVSRLRISVTVAPAAVHGLARGDTLNATVEGAAALARVEGMVPAAGGNLYTVNATLDNREGRFLAGSAATLALPQGEHTSIVIPLSAVVRRGDLTGVRVIGNGGPEVRWVRLGPVFADSVEVLTGLRDGERIALSSPPAQEN